MIDKKKYFKLCDSCDKLLLESDSTVQRISIGWLHVIREHPIILKKYENLFSNQNALELVKRAIGSIIENFRVGYHLTQSVLTKSRNIELGSVNDNKPVEFLFVSHLIESSGINNENDFYFGNLIKNLEAENINVITILINQIHNNKNELKVNYKLSSKRIILGKYLNFKAEIKLLFQLWLERKILQNKYVKLKKTSLQAKIIKEAANQCVNNLSLGNLRFYYQFKDIIYKYNPRNIITTFEGHAWERLLFCAAKEHISVIKCMGYHHTSLFKFQHSVLRRLQSVYNPDIILTTGEASRQRFQISEIGIGKKVEILGSNRGRGSNFSNKLIKDCINSCLVIPEGNDSECLILFRFSILCSKVAPNINFILKLHPIMNRDFFIKKYPEFRGLPSNVNWASEDIQFSFSISKWALYRGTTMIVQACYAGLVPLYLQSHPEEMSIDLLDEVSMYKTTLCNTDDFLKIIYKDVQHDNNYEHVMNYCDKLYDPFDHSILKLMSKGI